MSLPLTKLLTRLSILSDSSMLPLAHFNTRGSGPSIKFNAALSSDDRLITTYIWDPADGSGEIQSQTPKVKHEYELNGTYRVRLTVLDASGQSDSVVREVRVTRGSADNTGNEITSDADAARLLHQATFGPTEDSIAELRSLGINAWLDRQFSLRGPTHLAAVKLKPYSASNHASRHEVFWTDVVDGEDQLRQRVAYALSQILVVSDVGVILRNNQYAMTKYYDLLRKKAFGNYRDLLGQATLSPVMGLFLGMAKNEKANPDLNIRPDENYAREVMQLFSIGLHEMNTDGTFRLDSRGQRIPTFDQATVESFARVFTGWHYNGARWDQNYFAANMERPLVPFEEYHDRRSKTLLRGTVLPRRQGARRDLNQALDNIFNHPNVGPFVSKRLIERLVTSNPSPDYVFRVASMFNNNGDNVRGDLKAVVRAILTDPEARTRQDNSSRFGKLREPVIRLANLWRAFRVRQGTQTNNGEYNTVSPAPALFASVFGQAVMKSPSVFNFYSPFYSPPGVVRDSGIVAPEFQILTEANVLETTAFINKLIQYHYVGNVDNALRNAHLDLRPEMQLARNIDDLLDHLNILMLSGSMRSDLRAVLRTHLEGLSNTSEGRSQRARDAISLIAASPDYLIQM